MVHTSPPVLSRRFDPIYKKENRAEQRLSTSLAPRGSILFRGLRRGVA
jgi:hypothetical protein